MFEMVDYDVNIQLKSQPNQPSQIFWTYKMNISVNLTDVRSDVIDNDVQK